MSFETYISSVLLPFIFTIIFTFIIGHDREKHGKAAGVKTHMLVALGVCGIAIIQKEIYKDMILLIQTNQDLSLSLKPENQRLIAQVITGVGFLGAGAILKTNDRIEGLTTASSIWVVAMFALIFGLEYYSVGITLAILAVFWIKLGKRVTKLI